MVSAVDKSHAAALLSFRVMLPLRELSIVWSQTLTIVKFSTFVTPGTEYAAREASSCSAHE